MSHIFISYARKDINFAGKIVQALADNNLDTWIDWKSIPKGEDWEQEIYRGIEEADAFLFLISSDSVASAMCNKEIDHAVKNGKRILPIVIRDTDPKIIHPEISKRNWIFCREGQDDFGKAIEETRKTIQTDYEWLKYHTKLQVKALDWERTNDNSRLLRGNELQEAEQKLVELDNQGNPQPTKLQRKFLLLSRRHEADQQNKKQNRNITTGDVQQSVLITGDNAKVTIYSPSSELKSLDSNGKTRTGEDESLKTFIDWSLKHNATFSIPNLNLYLPISQAWARLTAISLNEEAEKPDKLSELIKHISNYREWYELARNRRNIESLDVEKIVYQHRLLVIVGGPGAGKSTLLRRLAWGLLQDGYLVLRVSLRTVALRMKKGESFEEAINATVLDGFADKSIRPTSLLSNCNYLLADGLDEAGEDRLMIADNLKKWVSSCPTLTVVVTTRPIGYNPSWFADWHHYELLPLKQENVRDFVSTIFDLLHQDDAVLAKKKRQDFSTEIEKSKIANIAARNPQLLGFLLSLFDNRQELTGNRSQLFGKIIDDIRQQTRLDKEFVVNIEKTIANFVIEHLGYLLLNVPTLSENEIEESLGKSLSQQSGISLLQSKQKVIDALKFWEERGLIERLSVGTITVFIFIHTAFQEFLAARYLEQLSDGDLINWLKESYSLPVYREPILLLGGTKRLGLVAKTLLNMDDIDDPVSTTIILTAGLFAESENIPPNLFGGIYKHLLIRLTSNIPTIADETASALMPIAEISPEFVGPIALKLSTQQNIWTIEAACVLGLVAGEQYVNPDTLLSVYLIDDEFSRSQSVTRFGLKRREHINTLIIEGGNYLLKHNPEKLKELVLERYNNNFHVSLETLIKFEALLKNILSSEEMSNLTKWKWDLNFPDFDKLDEIRRAEWQLILTAILTALKDYPGQKLPLPNKYFGGLSRLYSVLNIGETPATDISLLLKIGISDDFVEVIRGAILASGADVLQLRADTEQSLLLMNNQSVRAIEVFSEMELKIDVEIDWSLVKARKLNMQLLFKAMLHPVWFVCRFAALLLLEYANEPDVKSGMVGVLNDATSRAIHIIAEIAQEIWGEQAGEIVLQRLESNYTDECAPLVAVLGTITPLLFTDRATTILIKALKSKEVEMVKAAVDAIEKLNLFDALSKNIRARYQWWLRKGPQDPEESGVVPENAAKCLFESLYSHQRLDVSDIKEAVKSRRSDVRDAAIKAVCDLCTKDDGFFNSILDAMEHDDLPVRIIDKLEESQISFCALHIDDFLRLLDSENLRVKTKIIQLLGNKVLKTKTVEKKLRSLLESPHVELRDNALRSLRKLATR